jgi:uncharacterized membrane protein YeiH
LATVVGVAGGITRDVIFGRFPNAFSDPIYIGLTVAVGVAMFFLYRRFKSKMETWLVFDAVGLGVFSIIGASIAHQVVGMEFLPMLLGGLITAIGGGILRDVFVQVASIVGIVVTTAIRLLAMKFKWNLPKVRES